MLLSAPVLRLRGDYFALVTLGFGEVVRFTLRNLEEITAGTKGLKPIPPPVLYPQIEPFTLFGRVIDLNINWSDYRAYYLLSLTVLVLVLLLLRNLERRPSKAALSVVGIALATAIVFAGWWMFDAIDVMKEIQFERVERYDLAVTFQETRSAAAGSPVSARAT